MMRGANNLAGRKLILIFETLIITLSLSSTGYGQHASKPVSKEQALQGVKVSAVNGWKEAVSNEGRLRILFPAEPTIVEDGDEVAGLRGFKLITPEKKWVLYFMDFKDRTAGDDTQLREAYRQGIESIVKRAGTKMLRQDDVRLNGRLGSEFVIESSGAVSYMRAFQIQRRLYTLSVDVKKTGGMNPTLPPDVQQFFDSFTFWE